MKTPSPSLCKPVSFGAVTATACVTGMIWAGHGDGRFNDQGAPTFNTVNDFAGKVCSNFGPLTRRVASRGRTFFGSSSEFSFLAFARGQNHRSPPGQ